MNWPLVPLDELASVSGGSTPRRNRDVYWNGDVPWVTPSDLPVGGTSIEEIHDSRDRVTHEGLQSCSAPLLPPGTVLFSSRASIGKIGIATVPLATNQGFANFTPKPGVDARFLAYALRHFTPQITALAGSTTFKEVSRRSIRKFPIPLPPPSEQRRIVEILDQMEALQRDCAAADAKSQEIIPAIFMRMFGGDLHRSATRLLGDIAIDFRYGTSKRSEDEGYPALRIPNVVSGRLDLSEIKYVPVGEQEFERLRLKTGDLLIVRTNGNPDYVGRSVVFEKEIAANVSLEEEEFIFASYLIRIRVDRRIADPWFVQTYLSLSRGRRALRERCRTSAGQYNINIESLSAIPLPDVPLDRQRKLVNYVQKIRGLNSRRLEQRQELDCAAVALQHRAFAGDLTEAWRVAHAGAWSREMDEQAAWLACGHKAEPLKSQSTQLC